MDLVTYLSDAISRVKAGGVSSPSGSHLAGMFGKAANQFEKELRSFAGDLLQACSLTYPADLPAAVKRSPPFEKLTLGEILTLIDAACKKSPHCAPRHMPGGWKVAGFLHSARKINDAWVQCKHGDEISQKTLLERMEIMLTVSKLLREKKC